jgi:hypothetical protein
MEVPEDYQRGWTDLDVEPQVDYRLKVFWLKQKHCFSFGRGQGSRSRGLVEQTLGVAMRR